MRLTELFPRKKWLVSAVATVAAVLVGVFMIKITSLAASTGKITGNGVNVRAEASTSSEAVGTLQKNDTITINGQVTGADGKIWYQISLNGGIGYVRSDLATVTDGSTPDTIGGDGTVTEGGVPSIERCNPIDGTVTSDQACRVRQDASTASTILGSAPSGTGVTIKGSKVGASDSMTWYYVDVPQDDGTTITGFIRSTFITPSGDLTPLTPEVPETPAEPEPTEPEPEPEPVVQKDYDTQLQGEDWYLLDYKANDGAGLQYKITELFDKTKEVTALKSKNKKLVIGLVIAIILAVAGLGAAAFFFLKLRDAKDKAAFADAEKERRARIAGSRPAQGGARPAPGQGTARPVQGQPGQRPAGPNGRPPQGGQRPMPGPNGARPAQGGQRPMPGPNGARPAQGGQRPTGQGGARPVQGQPGQRPAGPNGARPVQGQGGQRPAGPNGARPAQPGPNGRPAPRPVQNGGSNPRGSKPVSDDTDEFEFGFLNWESKDKE